jgi:hypothetical protein
MGRNSYIAIFIIMIIALYAMPLSAETADPCSEQGIIVRNSTMLDLWYKRNGGACTIWIYEHIFVIQPKDTIEIFSGSNCEKLYCNENPNYSDYRSFDTNGNCGVKILPNCNISDM